MSYNVAGNPACDMDRECDNEPTHLEEKGYIYCGSHAEQRRRWNPRVRKMRAWERRWLAEHRPLPDYRVGPEPKAGAPR